MRFLRERSFEHKASLSFYLALFVNFVAIQYKFQLIPWYIAVNTPVRRKEKSCSFFFESKTFIYRGKIRHLGFFCKQQCMRKQPFILPFHVERRSMTKIILHIPRKLYLYNVFGVSLAVFPAWRK
ncbi:hypothetical protein D3H55_00520 [Bacillus salacetis]|uniref:Uncharacterized protein n=1 Tax=Bacillus salacetis TaxID=2315464 RepID=A0A3A1RD42_9BACI|nr:hypothetical protein D3H55_00520 [Bacillus salacetis]